MNSLISTYDNFLIYYPNVFFPAVFLFGIVGLAILIKAIISFDKIILRLVKKAGKKKYYVNLFIQKNIKLVMPSVKNLFILGNESLGYFQLHVGKIIKNIKKEIFIEE